MAVRNLLMKVGLVVGNAAAKLDPLGVAGQLLAEYVRHREREHLRVELEELLRLGFSQFRAELADAMGELRLKVAASVHGQVEAYLSQFQASARQAARILGDPSATTVPGTVGVDDPAQLAVFLPQRSPRFTIGDTVPGLPSWRLVEPLGSGGFGEVWKAENPYSGVTAFKFFLDPTARGRFTRAEAVALTEIHRRAPTDGVVKLLGAEPGQDPPWLQFEYVAGGDLSRLPEQWTTLPDGDRVNRVQGVISALAATVGHFHGLGVVHRDLKPSNVLVRPDGSLVVADFGISRIVPTEIAGSPTPANSGTATIRAYTALYASPQQKKFHPADRRDDVYALGVLWYQLLRGDLTLERPSGEGWKRSLAKLGVCEATVSLLNRCWDDEPHERPGDGRELAALLSGTQSKASPVPSRPPATPERGPTVPTAESVSPESYPRDVAGLISRGVDAAIRWGAFRGALAQLLRLHEDVPKRPSLLEQVGRLTLGLLFGLCVIGCGGTILLVQLGAILRENQASPGDLLGMVLCIAGPVVFGWLGWRWGHWARKRALRRLPELIDAKLVSLRTEFPNEMARIGSRVDFHEAEAVRALIASLPERLSEAP
jgi:serine/threonine protein kinase